VRVFGWDRKHGIARSDMKNTGLGEVLLVVAEDSERGTLEKYYNESML
jgi:hypothetical protein